MGDRPGTSRRQFLLGSSAMLLAAGVANAQAQTPAAAAKPVPLAPPDRQPPDLELPPLPTRPAGWMVVGLGTLALGEILPQFAQCARSRPTALMSGHRDKAERVATAYGVGAEHLYGYAGWEAVRDDATIDVVYVVTPNHLHAEHSVRALEAGKHVLCEKPMAANVAECRRMIDAARANGRTLMIAYRLRYEPFNQTAIAMARQRAYGTIQLIEAVNAQTTKAPNIRLSRETAGGPLGDLGIYCLNACRYLTGEEPTVVQGMQFQPADDPSFREVPATITWTMRFPSGALANCSCSFKSERSSRYRVHCDGGWFELDPAYPYRGQRLVITDEAGRHEPKMDPVPQFAREMDHLSACVLDGTEPWTPGEEGLADMRVIAAIEESIRTGCAVTVA